MGEDEREHFRVPGPFDGVRTGLLETPVRIFDLSEGGCFVTSLYEGRRGETLVLKIELPHEGWIEVQGETLYNKSGFGYAVRFTSVTPRAQEALASVVERRRKLAQRAG
jgi:PilZ domain